MILVIDNYDSFTYNLVQYMGEVTACRRSIEVVRNDAIDIDGIRTLQPSHLIISPGPCSPNEAGISVEVAAKLSGQLPILGVCLGHQAIGQAFGGRIVRAKRILHGKTSDIRHNEKGIFAGLPQGFIATRYHSLLIERKSLPACLEVIAVAEDDPEEIMAVRHRAHPNTYGVQFHPESILTQTGKDILFRFLQL